MDRLVEWAKRLVQLEPRPWLAFPLLLCVIALATLSRKALDGGAGGFLFAPYLPIILLTAVICGWRLALAATLTSLIAMQLAFLPPDWMLHPNRGIAAIFIGFLVTMALTIGVTEVLRTVIIRYEQQARQMESFNTELVHRNKNALQILIGLVRRGLSQDDLADYFGKLPARLTALGEANQLLRYGVLPACDLGELVDRVLAPFPRDRILVDGAPAQVDERVAASLALALHELATNALKYGALSTADGNVELRWRASDELVHLDWLETGGPPVVKPSRQGFGSRMVGQQRAFAEAELDFREQGLRAVLKFAGSDPGRGSSC